MGEDFSNAGATGGSEREDHAKREDPLAAAGAPPTNRAPDNCIDPVDPAGSVRQAIDSLYLSYAGELRPEWDEVLKIKKNKAQSDQVSEEATAQIEIAGHIFEVQPRGIKPFAYTLADNCFFIQVKSAKAGTIPLAYAQVSSNYLAAVGVEEAEEALKTVVRTFGKPAGPAIVSRADPFVDFYTGYDISTCMQSSWVYKAHVFSMYWHRGRFSGLDIGRGGDLSFRLYDKTLEVEAKSHKFYLHDLWKQSGWDGDARVWRAEFQARRTVLKELGINTVPELLKDLPALWAYLTEDWVRLTTPNPTDKTKTRWPTNPLWEFLAAVGTMTLAFDAPKLQRFSPARLPRDEPLYEQGLGYISSFMAARNIQDWGEGLGEYLTHMRLHFDLKGRATARGFAAQLQEKLRTKARRYNTARNRDFDVDGDPLSRLDGQPSSNDEDS